MRGVAREVAIAYDTAFRDPAALALGGGSAGHDVRIDAADGCDRYLAVSLDDLDASVASPLRKPRLKRSNGGAETPGPSRVVIAARTWGGAGQSGKIQLSVIRPGIGKRGATKHRTLPARVPAAGQ